MKRFGYRKDFSKVAVEKALFELDIWYSKMQKAFTNGDNSSALYFKAKGIIRHDRKCLYLS